jgi:hypothetical protein
MSIFGWILGILSRLITYRSMQDRTSVLADNQEQYRFKALFLPYLSYFIGFMVLMILWSQIMALISSGVDSINRHTFIICSLGALVQILIFPPLIALWFTKRFKIALTTAGICLQTSIPTQYVGWQEITSVKSFKSMGIRHLLIEKADGKKALVMLCFYDIAQILDRTRQLAGADHMLVRALEKEISRPRHDLRAYWGWIFGSSGLILSLWLIGGNIYAAAQEQPLEQAIASYVQQHPKTSPNQSAIELQSLMTKLGLSVKEFGDGSQVKVKPEPAKIAEWKEIEPNFHKYLTEQLESTEDSIEPLPSELAAYLKVHQADIDAIETHLLNQPLPQWGMDSNWLAKGDLTAGDSPRSKLTSLDLTNIDIQQQITTSVQNSLYDSVPGSKENTRAIMMRDKENILLSELRGFDLINIENLFLAKVIAQQQLPNADIARDLEAINKIQQSMQTQSSLVGQVLSRIGERKIAGLAQHLDKIPTGWGNNLFGRERYQKMSTAIEGESLHTSRVFQSPDLFNQLFIPKSSPLQSIPGYYQLSQPRIRLGAIDRDLRVKAGISYWQKQNICRATEMNRDMLFSLSLIGRDYQIDPLRKMLYQYPRVVINDLMWETSTNIRQIKAKLATGQTADLVAKEFKFQSQVCAGEQWTATATDGSVMLAISHLSDRRAVMYIDGSNLIKPAYKIKSIDQI